MPADSLLSRYEVFVSTAVVAAHTSAKGSGFRQRDVRFFIELFTNWVELQLPNRALTVQNTQVQRYLNSLSEDGFLRKLSRGKHPVYRLTRVGLLELVSRAVMPKQPLGREHFYFLAYYVRHYRPLIEALIKSEGRQFPYALKIELDALFDLEALLGREIERVKQAIKFLEIRVSDNLALSKMAEEMNRRGAKEEEVLKEIERLYPYEFNSQKSFSELILELPEGMRRWELEGGAKFRALQIWRPMCEDLKAYLAELTAMPKSK